MSKQTELQAENEALRNTLDDIRRQCVFAEREPRHTSLVLGRIQVLAETALEHIITVDPDKATL